MAFLFIQAALFIAWNGFAAETLTLEEAIRIAIMQHPDIRAAGYRLETEEAGITVARSGFFPQVHLSERFNRTSNPMWAFGTRLNQQSIRQEDFDPNRLNDPDPINNFNTALALSWEVFNGGRTSNGLEQAKQNARISSLDLNQIRQNIIARTVKAYSGLLLAEEELKMIRQVQKTARTHLDMVRSRYDAGFVVKSDLLRAQVRIAEIEQQTLLVESRLYVAQAALNSAMGYPDNRSFYPTTPFADRLEPTGAVEEWIQTALSRHPDLERLKTEEEISRKEIEKAKSGHWPNLELVGSYEIDSENFSDTAENYTVGAVMRLNLFSGHRISAGIAAAKGSLKRIQELQNSIKLKISLETRQAFYMAQSAFKRINVAEGAVEEAGEALRIMQDRYANGILPLVSLLDAETARQQALTHHFRARHDYQGARIDLALATGIIDADFK